MRDNKFLAQKAFAFSRFSKLWFLGLSAILKTHKPGVASKYNSGNSSFLFQVLQGRLARFQLIALIPMTLLVFRVWLSE